jgi:hypothetical protein
MRRHALARNILFRQAMMNKLYPEKKGKGTSAASDRWKTRKAGRRMLQA